jgi:hypothetical protein
MSDPNTLEDVDLATLMAAWHALAGRENELDNARDREEARQAGKGRYQYTRAEMMDLRVDLGEVDEDVYEEPTSDTPIPLGDR